MNDRLGMTPENRSGDVLQRALQSYRQGAWKDAEGYCRSALAMAPNHPGLLQMLGVVLMRQARPAEATLCSEEEINCKDISRSISSRYAGYGVTDRIGCCFKGVKPNTF